MAARGAGGAGDDGNRPDANVAQPHENRIGRAPEAVPIGIVEQRCELEIKVGPETEDHADYHRNRERRPQAAPVHRPPVGAITDRHCGFVTAVWAPAGGRPARRRATTANRRTCRNRPAVHRARSGKRCLRLAQTAGIGWSVDGPYELAHAFIAAFPNGFADSARSPVPGRRIPASKSPRSSRRPTSRRVRPRAPPRSPQPGW